MAKSLLVIDDSRTIREAAQLALSGDEWELVAASNGAEAGEALRQHRVDVILCAVALGEEDGYELCRTLGASAEGAGIPILLMGGSVNATAALAVGASATLPKPFSAEQLQQTLQETMEQSDFSFDFDDTPVTVADDTPLDLEPLAEDLELPPAAEARDPLELEEIEVIDLGDDDQFEDLELLDDLEPVELVPVQPAPGDGRSGDLDLGAGDGDLEDLLAGPDAPPATEEPDTVPMELTPEEPAAAGQGQGANWTVDGLLLGDDEASAPGPAPEPDGDQPPEEALPEAAADEDVTAEQPPSPPDIEAETPEEPVADALDEFAIEPAPESEPPPEPAPARADSYADLELEWASETPSPEDDGSPPEERIEDVAAADYPQEEGQLPPAAGPEPEPPLEFAWQAAPADDEESAAEDLAPEAAPTPPDAFPAAGVGEPQAPAGLAAGIAASAGQAVREALEQSLSAEHLAPLVEAAVERVAWEVVPQLAERLIRETIARLQEEPPPE
jgi:CheY-like chemotaxis protein